MKQYISILQLVSDMQQYLAQNKNTSISFTYGRDYTSYNSTFVNSPIFQIEETDDGYERITCLRPIRTLQPVKQILVPYPLELEYLRTSDYSFSDSDLEKLHQLMLLQYFQWLAMQDALVVRSSQSWDENTFLTYLEREQKKVDASAEKGECLPYLITGEDEPTMEWIEAELEKRYQARDTYAMKYSRPWYAKKHQTMWYAAPISSVDALNIIRIAYEDTIYRGTMVAHMLLFLPMFVTFSLLERKTPEFQSINWSRYQEYQRLANTMFTCLQEDNATEEERFSYGCMDPASRWEIPGDSLFINRILNKYFRKMKELAVDKNISIISIMDTHAFKVLEADKCQVLLNADTLTWDEEIEVNEDDNNISRNL